MINLQRKEALNHTLINMGKKRTDEELARQRSLAEMADYIYNNAKIFYQGLAEMLGLTPNRYQAMRTDSRYLVTESDISKMWEVFGDHLAGFGRPDARQQEIDRLLEIVSRQGEELEKVREALYTVLLREGWTEKEALERVLALLEQAREENER